MTGCGPLAEAPGIIVDPAPSPGPTAASRRARARTTTRFRVTYTAGTTDVTDQVNAGTYSTPELAPGAIHTIRAVVKVKATAPAGSSLTGTLTANSTNDPTVKDRVRFVTHRV